MASEKLEKVLEELFEKANELELILFEFESVVADVSGKPIHEMGISEKVKVAKLILEVRKAKWDDDD